MSKKNIAIRCITEKSKGYGNFTRALTLAISLKSHGHRVIFLINHNVSIESLLTKKKISFYKIPNKINYNIENNFLLNLYEKNTFELLILDMREYGEIISKKISKFVPTILIDDAFSKNVYSDIVVNGSINKKFHNYNIKNKNTKLLLGPKFFMANEKFLKNKKTNNQIIKKKSFTVLISIGGSDPKNLTSFIFNAIMNLPNIKIIIIIGPFFTNISKIKNLVKNKKNVVIKISPEKIWNEFAKADIIISKSGITLYELAIMGMPTLCISSFKHEEPSAKKFMKEKFLINLGMQNNVSKLSIKKNLSQLLDNTKQRRMMSTNGKKIVDGKGLFRITRIINAI
jgi:spore coat polysaccharide biosynthesis predicted glycosyltransferase SpsG